MRTHVRCRRLFLIAIAGLLLLPALAFARPVGLIGIYYSVERSELVALGQVSRITQGESSLQIDIDVFHVFRGDVLPHTSLSVQADQIEFPQLLPAEVYAAPILLLASKQHDGTWKIDPLVHGLWPLQMKVLFLPFDGTDLDAALSPGLDGLVDVLLASGELPIESLRHAPISPRPMLEFVKAGVGLKRLHRYYAGRLHQPDEWERVEALSAYIMRPEWELPPSWWDLAKGIQDKGATEFLVRKMREFYPNREEEEIATLVNCTHDRDLARFRLSCAVRLAQSGSSYSALSALAPMLDDEDPQVVAAAVGGLGHFANNIPVGDTRPLPGDWPFRDHGTMQHFDLTPHQNPEDREFFAGFWREWWGKNWGRARVALLGQ